MTTTMEAIQGRYDEFREKRFSSVIERQEAIRKQRAFMDMYREKRESVDFPDVQYIALMTDTDLKDRGLINAMVNEVEAAMAAGPEVAAVTPAEKEYCALIDKSMGATPESTTQTWLDEIDRSMKVGRWKEQEPYIQPMYRPGEATWASATTAKTDKSDGYKSSESKTIAPKTITPKSATAKATAPKTITPKATASTDGSKS